LASTLVVVDGQFIHEHSPEKKWAETAWLLQIYHALAREGNVIRMRDSFFEIFSVDRIFLS
jgi:hypothetical protein